MTNKTDKILSHLNQPTVQAGNTMEIPNHSGTHDAGMVRTTPEASTDIPNKAYVDASGITTPGTTTDNAIVRWDGTGGDTVQNTGVLVDDNDHLLINEQLRIPDVGTTTKSLIFTDASNQTLGQVFIDGGTTTLGLVINRTWSGSAWSLSEADNGVGAYFRINENGLVYQHFASTSTSSTTKWSVSTAGAIAAGADTDTTHSFGRCSFSSPTSDWMMLSHFDMKDSATNYGFAQNSAGDALMNAPSGKQLYFQIAGATKANLNVQGHWVHATRHQTDKGADVASATNVTLGGGGNYFDITGSTQIDTIVTTNWQAGSVIILQFDASVTVKHATAGTGAQLFLAGAGDFSATANDTLMLVYDGTYWREVSRSVN